MILYSIVPPDSLFTNSIQNGSDSNTLEIKYLGETVEVSPIDNNSFVIRRLISTTPKAYLNPKLQPGTIIKSHY